jgi:hypothetical protein
MCAWRSMARASHGPNHLNTRGGWEHASRAAAAGVGRGGQARHSSSRRRGQHTPTDRHIKPAPKKRGSRMVRRKRSVHVGLVGGVGARPVREVGDKEEGWRVVGVEDSGGQALAPWDSGAGKAELMTAQGVEPET